MTNSSSFDHSFNDDTARKDGVLFDEQEHTSCERSGSSSTHRRSERNSPSSASPNRNGDQSDAGTTRSEPRSVKWGLDLYRQPLLFDPTEMEPSDTAEAPRRAEATSRPRLKSGRRGLVLRGNTRAGAEWSARARRSRSQGASTRAVATRPEVESNAVESNHQSTDRTEITAREGAARRGLPLGVGAISTPATPDVPNQETALLRRLVDLTDPVRLRRAAERVPQLVRIPAEWRERVTIDGTFVGLGLLMAAIAWFGI